MIIFFLKIILLQIQIFAMSLLLMDFLYNLIIFFLNNNLLQLFLFLSCKLYFFLIILILPNIKRIFSNNQENNSFLEILCLNYFSLPLGSLQLTMEPVSLIVIIMEIRDLLEKDAILDHFEYNFCGDKICRDFNSRKLFKLCWWLWNLPKFWFQF